MGGKIVTNYDYDPIQGLFNPAAINPQMDKQLSVNYNNYLSDVNYGSVAYAYSWDRYTQVIHAGITYINYGDFAGYDTQGNPTNSFTGKESAFSIGYSTKIQRLPVYIGSNIRFITSSLEQYNSIGISADLGILYVNTEIDLNVGLVIRNFGTQLKAYDEIYEKLPFEIDIGVSQLLENAPLRWYLTFENLQKWNIGLSNPSRLMKNMILLKRKCV